eukprot:SAG31_NODE_25881_length_452_cov_0.866856_2_plen_42_part_01
MRRSARRFGRGSLGPEDLPGHFEDFQRVIRGQSDPQSINTPL